ncbi:MAG: FAD:protein FMN transferase, partial [Verrucomicrobiales bacterium]|nr:FAD:protein FMN transferase [Verrucomicrobiales bacterium]
GPPAVLPTAAEIESARASCGWRNVEVALNPPRLRKRLPELTLNVDAVAEGLAVDDLAVMLKAQGHRDFLINLGGEVMACGVAWAVGIQMPEAVQGQTFTTLQLQDEALATSGVYRQHFERDGQRFSHIIDPKTGCPVTHRLASVSVVAKTCTVADAWATALLVLGKEAGQPLAESLGLEVVWIGVVGDE